MTRPFVKIVNLETNEEIEREMNDEEYASYETTRLAAQNQAIAATEKLIKKQALLDRLGITEEEAKLLLG